MKLHRKIFLTMGIFILGVSILFVFATRTLLQDSLEHVMEVTHEQEINKLSRLFVTYYESNNGSWEGVDQMDITKEVGFEEGKTAFALLTPSQSLLFMDEKTGYQEALQKGVRTELRSNGKTIALLYYYDRDTLSLLQLKTLDSATNFLIAATVIFVILYLFIAYWLSKRFSQPLQLLVPVTQQLHKERWGLQAPVISKDELGQVTHVVNRMSQKLHRIEGMQKHLFIHTTSQLQTYVKTIAHQLELLQQTEEPVEATTLSSLQQQMALLSEWVDDLYLLLTSESNQQPVTKQSTDMVSLWQSVIQQNQPLAQEKEIEVMFSTSITSLNSYVDPIRMQRICNYLLIYCIQQSFPDEKILIQASQQEEQVQFTIRFKGDSMDSTHLSILFDLYDHLDKNWQMSREHLRIAVIKQLILAEQGSIDVESRSDQGNTFLLLLPTTEEKD